MKKILLLFVLLTIFVLTGCSIEPEEKTKDSLKIIKERGKLIVGYVANSKPFAYKDETNTTKGFDIDISKHIAKNILGDENAIEFVEATVYDAMSTVSSGKVDFLISAMTITPQRQIIVNFSEPYYTTAQAILVHKNSQISNIKDLNKKRIIVQINSTAEQTPKKYAPAAILLGVKTSDKGFEELKNGHGDALISDEVLLKDFIKENPDYKILPFKLTVEPYAIIIKNTDEANLFRLKINSILQTMRQDGTLEELKTKWNI